MADPWIWLVILIAAPVGSFMAAYADRACAGRGPWAPSSCAGCGRRIAARDLVPLWSWLRLGGRCRACGAAIPPRLLLAEILGLAAGLLAVAVTRGHADLAAAAVFLWCLLGLALTDLSCLRLPDPLSLALLAAGLGLAWAEARLAGAILGAVAGAGLLAGLRWIYRRVRHREGLGLGDVKLAAGLGAGLGAAALPWLYLLASAAALATAMLGIWGPARRDTALPFGLFLCAAAAVLIALRLAGPPI